jgi:phosphoglycolate phosphatase-like HAD superfamily hydrolase
MRNQFILFDFDGVIADSFWLALEINKMICPYLTETLYQKRFEGNINDWEGPEQGHTDECQHNIDFFDAYIPRMKEEVMIVPGIKEVVALLGEKYTLIAISSTITSPIQEFLEKHSLSQYFVQIMGNDVHKSKVEKIRMVFEKYNITSQDCVFITDTLGDMREGAEMNVGAIGVTWGFHKPETLQKGYPFCLVEKPDELSLSVSKYFDSL